MAVVGLFGFYWIPKSPATGGWLTSVEKAAALARSPKDSLKEINSKSPWREAFEPWKDWKMVLFSLTYPAYWSTTSSFLPQTNLWIVAPNCVGFVVLVIIAWSSDHFRERTYHLVFALLIGIIGLIILAAIDVLKTPRDSLLCMFPAGIRRLRPLLPGTLLARQQQLSENSRAATAGIFVGLRNLAGILSAGIFRMEYAPKHILTLLPWLVRPELVSPLWFSKLGRRERVLGVIGPRS